MPKNLDRRIRSREWQSRTGNNTNTGNGVPLWMSQISDVTQF